MRIRQQGDAIPGQLEPMLATLGSLDALGSDREWGFEMKWDGVRALVHVGARQVRLVSRNGIRMGLAYPEIMPLAQGLSGRAAVLGGEIVSFDDQGRPSFRRLQKRMHVRDPGARPPSPGTALAAVSLSQKQQLEGVVAKRLSSIYLPGRRSPDWVKIKSIDISVGSARRRPDDDSRLVNSWRA
jgi:bifunctional non-homologous end joining protein LigD